MNELPTDAELSEVYYKTLNDWNQNKIELPEGYSAQLAAFGNVKEAVIEVYGGIKPSSVRLMVKACQDLLAAYERQGVWHYPGSILIDLRTIQSALSASSEDAEKAKVLEERV